MVLADLEIYHFGGLGKDLVDFSELLDIDSFSLTFSQGVFLHSEPPGGEVTQAPLWPLLLGLQWVRPEGSTALCLVQGPL